MGFSPVRLEAEVWRSASAFPAAARRTARSLPTLASRPLVDRRLRSLGGTRPLFHGSCWPCGMLQGPPNSLNHLHPEGLGSAAVMLSAGVIAYFALICQSRFHPSTSRVAVIRRALPYGTVLAGTETFPLSPPFSSTMPSSSTPESPTGASTQFFPVDNCLRLGDKGSALPSPPSALSSRLRGLWWVNFSRLNRFAFATAWWIARLLDGPTWDYSRPPRLLLLSLRPTSHLLRTSGMASAPTGQSAPAGLSPA